jgi:hypothetical protein
MSGVFDWRIIYNCLLNRESMNKITIILLFLILSLNLHSQVVFEHISHKGIYTFLDEMASLKLIELNEVIKPYSREMICEKLLEVEKKHEESENQNKKGRAVYQLNKRQQGELDFYLKAYALENENAKNWPEKYDVFKKSKAFATVLNPPGLFYRDSVFRAGFQFVYGASYASNENGNLTQTYGGASLFGYIGKNIGFYTSVRDNNLSRKMISPEYFVKMQGVPFKNFGEEGIDYSEARGGIVYSWLWGNVGLVKDHIEWGTGYNGTNIQSGRTPSFAMVKLNLKPARWFEFNYYHGWLVSQVIDSTRSYWTNGTYRAVYYPKYMAANMFTFYPFKNFNFSFGNSVVYSDLGGPHAAYFIPFLFYKSVDHTLNSTYAGGEAGQNAQMFFNLSSRNIRYLHLYFTLYIDDLSFTHFSKKEEHNFFSYKTGARLNDFPFQNVSLTAEFTFTNPLVFQHKIATQTYASNLYNMGHYLRDNSRELYLALDYKPLRGMHFSLSYTLAQHGDDYSYADCANDPDCNLHVLPILKNITWENHSLDFRASYELFYNTSFYLNYRYADIGGVLMEKYTPEFYWSHTNTVQMGFNIGF